MQPIQSSKSAVIAGLSCLLISVDWKKKCIYVVVGAIPVYDDIQAFLNLLMDTLIVQVTTQKDRFDSSP